MGWFFNGIYKTVLQKDSNESQPDVFMALCQSISNQPDAVKPVGYIWCDQAQLFLPFICRY